MAFCSFSKDNDGSYTVLENKFITKYLPEADGFAVKVYLYGLYLCSRAESDFSLSAMAEVLHADEEKIREAFAVWEDYDLVDVISKDPFAVEYLPVRAAIGKPKKVRYERYAEFNMELQRKMQRVGKFVTAAQFTNYMRFLEETQMQPQALLLIVEYCIAKDGKNVVPHHVFNKANQLLKRGYSTYEQVEKALSNYNANEGAILDVYNAMSIFKDTPEEGDYAFYEKWTEKLGFQQKSILAVAKAHKGKNFAYLDTILEELARKEKREVKEIEGYLTERPTLLSLTRRLANKLGLKIQNPAPYADEYVEKWLDYGFEESSLLDLALYCLKTERGSFEVLGDLLAELFKEGIIAESAVKAYLKERNAELKLFAKVQGICGGIRRSETNLALVRTWKSWNFGDEMILEAASRSASSSNPVPYMNKILSDWKQAGVFEVKDIPASPHSTGAGTSSTGKNPPFKGGYTSPAIEAANAKAERERHYALLREKAQTKADKAVKKANGNPRFKTITAELARMEIALAKAEVFTPSELPALQEKQAALLDERKALLQEMGMTEAQLAPQYACPKCQDSGFLPSGVACDCYKG